MNIFTIALCSIKSVAIPVGSRDWYMLPAVLPIAGNPP